MMLWGSTGLRQFRLFLLRFVSRFRSFFGSMGHGFGGGASMLLRRRRYAVRRLIRSRGDGISSVANKVHLSLLKFTE